MMGGKPLEEKSVGKPVKSLAVRSQDNRLISMIEFWCQVVTNKLSFRRTLKYYKEQLKMKSRRSRLLILAIADKLNEKEMENVQVKISYCRHQLLAQSLLILTTWSRMCKNQGKLAVAGSGQRFDLFAGSKDWASQPSLTLWLRNTSTKRMKIILVTNFYKNINN